MKRSYLSLTKFNLTLIASIFSCYLQANSSHQFSIALDHKVLDFEEGEASFQNIKAKAYFNPVEKNASLPYSRTAFYSRTGSMSLSAARQEWSDMNVVMGGRVFNSGDINYYRASTFLAEKSLPVWGQLGYQYNDAMTYEFSVGSSYVSPSESSKHASIGWYIEDTSSLYALYSKGDKTGYGLGFKKLFNFSEYGFLETEFQISRHKDRDSRTVPLNNVVRNLDMTPNEEQNKFISLSYFPQAKTELNLSFLRSEQRDLDVNIDYYMAAIEHYVINSVRLGFNYTLKDTYFRDNFGDTEIYGVNVLFEF